MSLILPGGLPDVDRQGNAILTSFRNMIRLESLMYDPDFSDIERSVYALRLLYGKRGSIGIDNPVGELLWFYHCGEPPEDSNGGGASSKPRLYDFEIDARYIYAGFRQAYGIDLSIKTGLALHWWEFMDLFVSLPEDTAMWQRMHYRGVDTSQMEGKEKQFYETRKKDLALPRQKTPAKSLAEMEEARKQRVARRFAQVNQQKNGGE